MLSRKEDIGSIIEKENNNLFHKKVGNDFWLDKYINNKLNNKDRETFKKHLLVCDACKELKKIYDLKKKINIRKMVENNGSTIYNYSHVNQLEINSHKILISSLNEAMKKVEYDKALVFCKALLFINNRYPELISRYYNLYSKLS